MGEVGLHGWHAQLGRPGLWSGPGHDLRAGHDLREVYDLFDMLDEGRLVMALGSWPSVAVDPHHPTGGGMDDLGNLVDLMGHEEEDDEQPTPSPSWIEITVVDSRGEPIRGRPYRLHLPDGSVREGRLGDDGIIRFDDVDPGLCMLELPTDEPAQSAPPPAMAA